MGITNTTYITCDAKIKGKPCGRTFSLPDDESKNTPGVEETVSWTVAKINKSFYFCNTEHCLRFILDYVESEKADKKNAEKVVNIVESSVATMPEDLNLREN